MYRLSPSQGHDIGPLLLLVRRPFQRHEEWGPVRLVLFFLGFCFSGGIDEVVATMACWNKVSPVSPYLDGVRPGASEGPVRVCVPRYVVSLQILAVYVFQGEILAAFWCGNFDIFFCVVLWLNPVSPTLWSGGGGLQACSAWGDAPADAASTTFRSRLKGRVAIAVFKALYGEGICRCCFSLLLVQCNFQSPAGSVQSEEEED